MSRRVASANAARTEEELLRHHLAILRSFTGLLAQNESSVASQTVAAFAELLDDCVLDLAQEVHREARTGALPPSESLDAAPAAPPDSAHPQHAHPPPRPGCRGPVDVFGQSHPAKATDVVSCRNCGRHVQAGSFAPHLEKCMGKGRAAARAASRRMAGQS
ncbi:SAGA-associated factor 11 [Tetrabaena socialis]|uniref:SAGA-associated factor 11 n=1 Tax=Tetrabaena socialis TaxID=47790 RepID=A0A2J8AH53_9CHLO|nr:SAGA-associated factor 11 [Tetrabaena socialis]|eukprot:PNH11853.1 SAGA-associated factor 11 [Tetrabaena socialis]